MNGYRDTIPAAERFDWQPEELVAVFGTHAWRTWDGFEWEYPWLARTKLLFTQDGRQVIALDHYGCSFWDDFSMGDTGKTWDAATGKLLHRFTLRKARALDLVPGMRAVAMTAGDQFTWTAKLWDIDTGKEKLELVQDGCPPSSFAAFPDGKRIVSWTGANSDLRLWDAATGKEQPPLSYGGGIVAGASSSPDGKALAVIYGEYRDGGQLANFKLYDLTTRAETGSAHVEGKGFYGPRSSPRTARRSSSAGLTTATKAPTPSGCGT